ncbi:MAG: leucine-rich repeat domain-containing protein [Clostridia bacterium]|nr:leucine-rich repeat domain-containing protein [Clostridia bacterium]
MITYDLSLERQNMLGADKFSITADCNETVSFRFHFDRSWRIFDTKAAVFKSSKGRYYVLDIKANCVCVPWEVLRDTSGFELAVVAYEKEAVLTSKKVRIAVASSLLPEFCKQLSPTETIFDRFKTEAENKAYLDCRDEIQTLKRNHEKEIFNLNAKIAEEKRNTENVTAQKNAEIAQLNYEASCVENSHRLEVAQLQSDIDEMAEKAHNWELIDAAIRNKTSFSNTLFAGGTQLYELPVMNYESLRSLGSSKISTNITKVELNAPNIKETGGIFSGRTNLKTVILHNTEKIETLDSAFSGCTNLTNAYLGKLIGCRSLSNAFSNCRSLEYLETGEMRILAGMYHAFEGCCSLKEINGTLFTQSCTDFGSAFSGCANLETVRFAENSINKSIDFGYCVNLSKESIYSIVNALNELMPATVSFAEHALNTNLTPAEKAEVINTVRNVKGWTLELA